MSRSNTEIVRDYMESINNHKQFERIFEYCDRNCVFHYSPYIGLGINADDRSGDRVILSNIAPNGPAAGHLQVGDELIRVTDSERTWETYDELKNGLWGQGVAGSLLTITVRRNGKVIDIHLERGPVDGWKVKVSSVLDVWQNEIENNWHDYNVDIKMIFEKDDLVACYFVNGGTNQEYHHTAVWGEMDILRLKDGKITDIWVVEDRQSMLNQLGYKISEPEKEKA